MASMLIFIPTTRVLNVCLLKIVNSPTTKVVETVKRLCHHCSLPPRQGQYVFGRSKSMTLGSVSHVAEGMKDLV